MKLHTFTFITLVLLTAAPAWAQTVSRDDTITTEGVTGDVDDGRRSPVLSVRPVVGTSEATLLVDTSQLNRQFVKYPVRVDFFINRKLFASQIRSPELPGPLGVSVSSDVATPPFNYSIVATVLHPNRTYTTVLSGAVFAQNFSRNLSCTATVDSTPADSDVAESTDYMAEDVATSQTGNSAFTLTFDGKDETGAETAAVSASLSASGTDVTGSVTTTIDGVEKTSAVTGSVETLDGTLASFEVASEDGTTTLSCT